MSWLRSLIDGNEREVARLRRRVEGINALDGALPEILPEAFAVVREASKRTLGMRHFDVQMIGGQVLHEGRIAEMATGEGKTLVASLPLYLNALVGKGAHLVTVNDYLAKRDATWNGVIYHLLGLTVAVIQSQSEQYPRGSAWQYTPGHVSNDPHFNDLVLIPRRDAYRLDILYGTNH